MEIGSEISRKIRTAIKGKLRELGAYVDEELPDYIMVMVANKKSQELMIKDLKLFLGDNTLRFTTWLQGVLDKLRAITPGSNSLKASEAIIFNSSMPPLRSQSSEDSGREPQETFDNIMPSSSQAHRSSDRGSTDAVVAARLTSAVKPLQELSPSEDIIDIKLDMDDVFNDDLGYSLESPLQLRKRPASVTRTQRPTAQVYRPPGSSRRLDEPGAVHRLSHSVSVPSRQSGFHGNRAVGTKSYEMQEACRVGETFRSAVSTERTLQERFEGSRKRKIPVASSVVKVRRYLEEFEEEEEEEEDDYTSRASAIPSSVSVPSRPERRPTLPPSKQANKNLILKAISEAQESITKTTSYSTVPPKQMVPVAPRARPVPEEELILMKSRASILRYQEEPEEAPAVESRQVDERRMDVLSRLHPEPVQEATAWGQADERRMDVLSRLHPEPMQEATAWGQDIEEMENLRPMDSRSFILKSPKVSKTPPMQTPPTTETPQQFGRVIQPRENIIPEKPASPKFIVTLDGVPSPRGYHSDEDMEVEPSAYTEEGLYAASHTPLSRTDQSHLTHQNTQDVRTINDTTAVHAKAKIQERCKYWPACKNAENCAYHHPTTLCKAFPKCRFAEKCFFIHPNCKFDAKCTKADCPYTHASRRKPPAPKKQELAAVSHVKVQCRYFPSCRNTECPYYHPKHCRFSNNCTRVDCEFYHPTTSVPPRHALTWTRSQASD